MIFWILRTRTLLVPEMKQTSSLLQLGPALASAYGAILTGTSRSVSSLPRFGLHIDQVMVTTQKGKDLATSNWLRDTVAQGSPLPYADYVALPELKDEDEKLSSRNVSPPSEKSSSRCASRITSYYISPPARSQSPSPAAHKYATPPAFLLPSPDVELCHTARFCSSTSSHMPQPAIMQRV